MEWNKGTRMSNLETLVKLNPLQQLNVKTIGSLSTKLLKLKLPWYIDRGKICLCKIKTPI